MVSFLHTSGSPTRHPTGHVPFSFADDLLDRTQPVCVTLGGFEYPGEVIVAGRWRAEFGRPLSGVSMFRLVLLHSTDVPAPDDIVDDRICVAAPRVSVDRIGETRSTYFLHASGKGPSGRSQKGRSPRSPDRPDQTASDIRSLREVRRSYITANDPGLGRLASALATYESQINASVAADLHEMWKSGVVITSPHRTKRGTKGRTGPKIQPGELFLLGDPESWVESAATALDRGVISGISGISGDQTSPGQIYDELQTGRLATAREHLRQLCGIRIDEPTPVDRIDTCIGRGGGEVSGDDLVQLLVHELRYPPAIASLWLVVHVLDRGAELVLFESGVPERAGPGGAGTRSENLREYLSGNTISEFDFDAGLITRTVKLHSEKSDAWDAVLPFLKLIAPQANFTAFGGGRDSDATEFELQLATLHSRMQQASPAMFRLEIAAGATDRPLTRNATRLNKVLSVESWREYVVMARGEFGSVGALKAALIDAAHQWAAIEYAADIERTVQYLDQVEFGRVDHALAVEHRVLRSRFDLRVLIENPNRWRALRDEIERWRQEYRKAYLEDHSLSQERDRTVRDQIERTTKRVLQIDQFERIFVLRDGLRGGPHAGLRDGSLADIPGRWNRVAGSFRVCDRDGSDILLIDGPACPGCQARLGQATTHADVLELITEVEQAFESYRDHLAAVVSDLVLNSETSDRLQKLFRLNSAGDLSDLANVLDDKVISFLNELFGNTSGNLDDWTLPHS
ncbi:MAG: hypothetical protein IH960_01240 [Chloroflexi bacterium]|nr:hypothetical protein [Chloroflexota bacterium]